MVLDCRSIGKKRRHAKNGGLENGGTQRTASIDTIMAQSFVIKRRAKQVPPTIFKITKGPVEIDLMVILDLVLEAS